MSFGLDPGKLGFKLGEVLVGLKAGTTDVPETITSDQGKLHTLGYLWSPTALAYVLPTVDADGGLAVHVTNAGSSSGGGLTDAELRASPVPVVLPPGGGGLTDNELRASPVAVGDDTVGGLLRRMLALLMSPRGYDKSTARQRVTANIENLPTLAAVTTVTTVSNLAQIAGRDGVMLINPTNRTSWALTHRSRIT